MKLLFRMMGDAKRFKGLYAIAILSTLLMTLLNLIAPMLLSEITKALTSGLQQDSLEKVLYLTAALAGVYLLRVLFRYASNYYAHVAAWNLVEGVRVKLYKKIQSFSMRFFHERQTGDLMSRVVNDTATFELLYAHIIPEMLTNLITLVGVLVMLLSINVKLALLTCIPLPLIAISGYVFLTKIRPHFHVAQAKLGALNSKLQDNFSGIHEIQAFGKERAEEENVGAQARDYTAAILKALQKSAIFHPSVEFFSSIGTLIVAGVGGALALNGEMDVADIVAFLLYLALFYAPITGFAKLLEDTQQAYAGAERVMAVMDAPSDIVDEPDAADIGPVRGKIEFENVQFGYEKDQEVLRDVSFACEPGEMIALIGPTGVGKTTLTQLISRFYDPTSGRVLIDGKDIKHVTIDSLRRNIAPVMQDTFLFYGTIAENIGYAAENAAMEEVVAAAKAAHIHEDIMDMPGGYGTRVGERGARLSGGQKQRVAIARAVLRRAPIIILDEATASVDVETEREIQNAINELAGSCTIIAIAHRLTTIRNADKIFELKDGRLARVDKSTLNFG
ncbi:MAG TPA: ABC transporter ATP-binding protein [Feifaniaceae bacterium]|nr:ABC transporter ATP-binding protein [Feifaniaceae bacterium]